jgi:hypothetical protein
MAKREQLYAELPRELIEADVLLRQYGRWAMDRFKPQKCGSAEGNYKAAPNDEDRLPRECIAGANEIVQINRALQAVPELERTVLMWLYVPSREPVQVKMRKTATPPKLMQERHLAGVRMFWNNWQKLQRCNKEQAVYKYSIAA